MRLKLRGPADDVVGDQGLLVLRDRPRDQPFCLLYQFKSPHRSWIPAARFARMYEDIEIPLPRTFEDKLAGRPDALRRAEMPIADMPDFRDRGVDPPLPSAERKRLNLQHLVKNYYRVLLSVDENVGRLLEALDRDGLTENTIVVYTSDNGFFLGEHGLFDKRLMYEPSIRVPMLVRFPARVGGGVIDRSHMVLNVDVAPTLLELAGVPVPAGCTAEACAELSGRRARRGVMHSCTDYEYHADNGAKAPRGAHVAWKLMKFFERRGRSCTPRQDPDGEISAPPRTGAYVRVRARMELLRTEVGDDDPPGPAPVAAPCGNGVNTGYGPP